MSDPRAQRLTLIACILGSAIVFVDGTVVNVALPALRDDLDASLAGQQWVVEAYLLTLGSLILIGGSLGDLYGRRTVFGVGVAGFGVASLLCALAPSVEVLIAARGLQGVFGALLVPSSLAIITATFAEGAERGRAIGSWTAWTSAAIAVGPPLGGLLVDAVSWRMVFAINVPFLVACLWLIVRAVPELPGVPGERVDVVGALLCAAGLGGPVYALIQQPVLGWADIAVWLPLAGGIGALAAFVAYEHMTPRPMLPLGVFRSRNFSVGNVATFVVYAGLGAATFFVAIFLQQIAGYTALAAGSALLPISLAIILLSSRVGALSQRIGPRLFMGGGPLVAGAGLLLFLRVDAEAAYVTTVLPAAAVFGIGLALTVAPLTATVLAAADQRHAGIASGVNNAIARVAGLIAIAAVGAVVSAQFAGGLDDRLAGQPLTAADREYVQDAKEQALILPDTANPGLEVEATAANVDAFHAGMLVSGVLVILGGVICLVGIDNPRRRAEPVAAAS